MWFLQAIKSVTGIHVIIMLQETNPTATDGENVRHGDIDPTPEASINQSMMRHISLGNTHHKPTPALPETPNIPSIHPQVYID